MPQRKTHDVYAGNQKVGEIWESYQTKSSLESEMNVKISAAQMCLRESQAQDAIDKNHKLKKKQQRMEKNYEKRDVAGIVLIVLGIVIAVIFFAMMIMNPKNIFDMISLEAFYLVPGIIFALGFAFRYSMPELDTKRKKPKLDWGGIIGMSLGCGVGFTFGYFLLTMFIRRFFLM